MDNFHPQAELLLAYVDKQLTPEELIEAETLLANDSDAVAFIKTLESSQLPFSESFDFLLEDKEIDSENVALETSIRTNQNPEKANARTLQWPASLAASVMLGLVIGYAIFTNDDNKTDTHWITDVANYHLLYVRDTVTPSVNLNNTEKLSLQAHLGNALKSDLNIPDLNQQKLVFKRGQILDIEGKTLIQLAYLPDDGLPVALCILRSDADDSLPESGESRGLPFVKWSKNGLSYVIIGKMDKKSLETAALNAMAQI
ncbi:MAG: anti-sigma factor RsiW [Cocleimonas sp.]|jgi:anti-sigma factor RsiW